MKGRVEMIDRAKLSIVLSIVVMLFIATPGARAADMSGFLETHGAEVSNIIKSTVTSILGIVKDPSLLGEAMAAERREKLSKTLSELFSFEEMAKRSLGRHWKDRTQEERKEFTEVFSKLIEASYIGKIEKYTDEKVVYSDVKIKEKVAMVKTRIVKKSGGIIPVSYKLMHSENGDWQVYDVVIVGISMVRSYRTRFDNALNSSTYDEFIVKLKEKAEKA
jgi:phospholipid transport system substrate-binding protein